MFISKNLNIIIFWLSDWRFFNRGKRELRAEKSCILNPEKILHHYFFNNLKEKNLMVFFRLLQSFFSCLTQDFFFRGNGELQAEKACILNLEKVLHHFFKIIWKKKFIIQHSNFIFKSDSLNRQQFNSSKSFKIYWKTRTFIKNNNSLPRRNMEQSQHVHLKSI